MEIRPGHPPRRQLSVNVGIVYATDFGNISRGGIQTVVRSLGEHRPGRVRATYFGAGALAAPLPTSTDAYVDVFAGTTPMGKGPLNLRYAHRLISCRRSLQRMDILVCHRAEHLPLLPSHPARVLVLHGGTRNALLSGKHLAFGAAYPLVEITARALAAETFTVSPEDHFLRTAGTLALRALAVPLDEAFLTAHVQDRNRPLESLGFCGRLDAEKRPDLVIRAAAEAGLCCDLFGDGPLRAELTELANTLGVPLRVHGHVGKRALVQLYQQTATVLLSTSRFEGYSVAVVEAAACGVPVVGLAAPGVARAIAAVGGTLVEHSSELPTAAREAWRTGNVQSAQRVRHQHDPSVISQRFWNDCLSVAQ